MAHKLTMLEPDNAQHHRPRLSATGGGWSDNYHCVICNKNHRFMRNLLRGRAVVCDGRIIRFLGQRKRAALQRTQDIGLCV